MQVIKLCNEERIQTGCSHVAIIDYTDLNTTAGTTKTLTLAPYIARDFIDKLCFDLITPFDGGATSALGLEVGWNGASVDDPNGLLESAEVHVDATEILAGDATGAAFAAKRTGFAAQEAGDIEALFTATGANLTALTTGKVRIYFNLIPLSKLRGINNT
jgi:hypothetical protein